MDTASENNRQTIFRKKTLDRISSPDNLKDYLRVSNPGIWAVLVIVILLLGGLLAWSTIGVLETRADVRVVVADHQAQIIALGAETLSEGMSLTVADKEYTIASVTEDEYGRPVGMTKAELPDGVYEGTVVTETIHPISFLLESR